jgi:flagellar biosynthetic protein FliR
VIHISLEFINYYLAGMLVFIRVSACLYLAPGFGEMYIPVRIKLLISLTISLVLVPVIKNIPIQPANVFDLVLLIIHEMFVGLFIGSVARIMINTMNMVGGIFATQTGLGAAMLFDPAQGTQSYLVANFLGIIALLMIFATNTHHLFILGLIDSYEVFKPHESLIILDFTEVIINTIAYSFLVAIKIASPQIVVSIMFFLAGGILSRLMPSMQIFFVMAPAQIMIGFYILMVTLSASMLFFAESFAEVLQSLF